LKSPDFFGVRFLEGGLKTVEFLGWLGSLKGLNLLTTQLGLFCLKGLSEGDSRSDLVDPLR